MKLMKIFAASLAILGALVASQSAQAHFTLNAGTGAAPVFLNGAPGEWLAANATVPSLGYLGMHSATNDRVFQTGLYQASATVAELGGVYGGASPTQSATTQGQLYTYNTNTPASLTIPDVSVSQNSWTGSVVDTNTNLPNPGLSWSNPHFSSGSGNPELNLKNAGNNYVNITLGDDPLFAGSNQLAFSLYQGWAKGPGLTGMNLLYTGTASSVGQDLGVSLALTGNNINGDATAGEYTIVVGDLSTGSGFDGHYRIGFEVNPTATAGYTIVSAVPVPGAVWLFGSALMGYLGLQKRKMAA